jgi:hypothetical protein
MSIATLQNEIAGMVHNSAYERKMMHRIPAAISVDRIQAVLAACRGKIALDIGCAGSQLHEAIKQVAVRVYGVDREGIDGDAKDLFKCDLDRQDPPTLDDVDIVICGEIIEHLSNPGFFLDRIHWYKCPILFTVPNAFSEIGRGQILKGTENVNIDHVAWYSWRTFRTLIERHGFQIDGFWWYGGDPLTSEGLLFLVKAAPEAKNGRA